MTAFAAEALQVAVYAALDSNVALKAAVNAVYDEPDPNSKMPYVSLGPANLESFDTKTETGGAVTFDVNAWSSEPSHMQVKEIASLVDAVMVPPSWTVAGFKLVTLRLTNANFIRQHDNGDSYYRARLTYRAQLRKT